MDAALDNPRKGKGKAAYDRHVIIARRRKKARSRRSAKVGEAVELLVRAQESLSASVLDLETTVSPQVARSVQATENAWRRMDAEFGLLAAEDVAVRLGYAPTNRAWAATHRRASQLLGVRRGGRYRYPGFQLTDTGVLPVVPKLLELAAAHDWAPEGLALWLCTPTGYLEDGARPVDLLAEDPAAVLAAAASYVQPRW